MELTPFKAHLQDAFAEQSPKVPVEWFRWATRDLDNKSFDGGKVGQEEFSATFITVFVNRMIVISIHLSQM